MDLEKTHTQFENDLQKQGDEIIQMRDLIADAEQKTKDKQQERKDLQTSMDQLSEDNTKQKGEVDEKK